MKELTYKMFIAAVILFTLYSGMTAGFATGKAIGVVLLLFGTGMIGAGISRAFTRDKIIMLSSGVALSGVWAILMVIGVHSHG